MTSSGSETKWEGYWRLNGFSARILGWGRSLLGRQLCRYFEQKVPNGKASPTSLEAGCGSAIVSGMLANHGWHTVALDREALPLRIARELSPRVQVVQGDLYRSCFHKDTFDLVWNNSTLEHLAEPLEALKEMAAAVRPGGFVFVGVPYTFGPLAVFKLKRRSFADTWDGTTYSCKDLVQLFERAGLQVLNHRLFFMGCFVGAIGRKP